VQHCGVGLQQLYPTGPPIQSTDSLIANGCVNGLIAYDYVMISKSIPKPTNELLFSVELNESELGFLTPHSPGCRTEQ
jgi:hypothetical protein